MLALNGNLLVIVHLLMTGCSVVLAALLARIKSCRIMSVLTLIFFLIYLSSILLTDYKAIAASIYTLWYMIYLVYITIGYFLCVYYQGITAENKILENDDEFRRIEYALKEWIAQKRYCEYEQSREEIAKELNTTKENLHHYFLSRKGMDFNAWRTELRIEEAKKMLIENMDFPINIIGELAGFSDRSNFHRQFVKSVGCTPKRWRESHGKP